MKFDFSDISFGGFNSSDGTGTNRAESVINSVLNPPSFVSKAEREKSEGKMDNPFLSSEHEASRLLDTFLKPSTGDMKKKDSISDFYSDLRGQSVSKISKEH